MFADRSAREKERRSGLGKEKKERERGINTRKHGEKVTTAGNGYGE